jgi:Protein of unknown function (DUF2946)
MLYQVTSNTGSATRRSRAPLARFVAFMLLALVIYATTAASVHKHGGLLLNAHGSSAPAVNSSDDADSSANDSRATGECLICQLRQQLSFTLLNAPPLNLAPPAQLERVNAASLPSFSRADAPQRGRAPPLASLS